MRRSSSQRRLFPAVEAGVGDELDPLGLGHVAELAADQADLVVAAFADSMLRGLLEAHDGTSGKELENQLFDYADSTASKDDGQAHELGKPIATPLLPAHRHCTHPGFTQQCCGLYHLITIWSIAMPP